MNLKFRYIILMMMATVLMGSCGRDITHEGDVTEVPVPVPEPGDEPGGDPGTESGTVITFMASQQQETAVTRAATPLSDHQTTFTVWGYKNYSYENDRYGDVQTVFPGYTVQYGENSQASTTTNTAGWEYILATHPDQSIKYWDWKANAYRFFGASGEVTGTPQDDEDTHSYELALPADTLDIEGTPFYTRLWFSDGNPILYPTRQFGQTVQLEFLRPFAKVRFLFIPADESVNLENLTIEDPSFAPANAGQGITIKGTFKVSYPLDGTATKESWTVERSGVPGSSMVAFTQDERWYTVLPAQAQGAYELTVTVAGDPDKGCTVPAEFMNWLPSYKYTYIFKVNDEGGIDLGEVKSAYTDWLPGQETTKVIVNW